MRVGGRGESASEKAAENEREKKTLKREYEKDGKLEVRRYD